MHPWIMGNATVQGTKLHYYRSGGAGPPLVLVHGITDDGLCWTPVADRLSGAYDAVMVDLRGHGKSDAPEEGYDLATVATELSGLITGLALDNPFVMGHSLGAATAMTLAGLAPHLPRAIVLEDPPAFWRVAPPAPGDVDSRASMRGWFKEVKRQTRDELLDAVRALNPDWPEPELGPWADAKHRFSPRIDQMMDTQQFVPGNFRAILGRITCPVLLITADPARGAIVTDKDVAGLRELVPHLEVVNIAGAGHNIRREQFATYIKAVQRFLTRHAG